MPACVCPRARVCPFPGRVGSEMHVAVGPRAWPAGPPSAVRSRLLSPHPAAGRVGVGRFCVFFSFRFKSYYILEMERPLSQTFCFNTKMGRWGSPFPPTPIASRFSLRLAGSRPGQAPSPPSLPGRPRLGSGPRRPGPVPLVGAAGVVCGIVRGILARHCPLTRRSLGTRVEPTTARRQPSAPGRGKVGDGARGARGGAEVPGPAHAGRPRGEGAPGPGRPQGREVRALGGSPRFSRVSSGVPRGCRRSALGRRKKGACPRPVPGLPAQSAPPRPPAGPGRRADREAVGGGEEARGAGPPCGRRRDVYNKSCAQSKDGSSPPPERSGPAQRSSAFPLLPAEAGRFPLSRRLPITAPVPPPGDSSRPRFRSDAHGSGVRGQGAAGAREGSFQTLAQRAPGRSAAGTGTGRDPGLAVGRGCAAQGRCPVPPPRSPPWHIGVRSKHQLDLDPGSPEPPTGLPLAQDSGVGRALHGEPDAATVANHPSL